MRVAISLLLTASDESKQNINIIENIKTELAFKSKYYGMIKFINTRRHTISPESDAHACHVNECI